MPSWPPVIFDVHATSLPGFLKRKVTVSGVRAAPHDTASIGASSITNASGVFFLLSLPHATSETTRAIEVSLIMKIILTPLGFQLAPNLVQRDFLLRADVRIFER